METQDCMDFAEFFAEVAHHVATERKDFELVDAFKKDAQKWAKFALCQ